MIALTWQTLLLVAIAYFLGCWLACLLRRMIGPSATDVVVDAAAPAAGAAAAATGVAIAARQRQDAGDAVTAPQPVAPVRDAFRRADRLEPLPEVVPPQIPRDHMAGSATASVAPPASSSRPPPPAASSEDTVARFERALAGQSATPAARQPSSPPPARPSEPRPPMADRGSTGAEAAATAAAAAAAAAGAAAARGSAVAAPPRAPAAPPPTPAAQSPAPGSDDLKRIRTIDSGVEAALHRAGVHSYADIAAWRSDDVARISQLLGVKGRIEQENWIEQAQILARGQETRYSSRLAGGELTDGQPAQGSGERQPPPPVAPPTPQPPRLSGLATAGPVTQQPEPARPPMPPPAASGIDRSAMAASSAAAAAAAAASVVAGRHQASETRVEEQARQTLPADVTGPDTGRQGAEISHDTGSRSGVEAAAAAAAAMAAAAAASAARPARDLPRVVDASDLGDVPATVRAPDVADRAAFAGTAASEGTARETASTGASPEPAESANRRAVGSTRDNLQRIGGITPEIEKLLNVQGVSRYAQVARWSSEEAERFDRLLGYHGRIKRENWIEQAQILSRGGDTAYSREHDRRDRAPRSWERAESSDRAEREDRSAGWERTERGDRPDRGDRPEREGRAERWERDGRGERSNVTRVQAPSIVMSDDTGAPPDVSRIAGDSPADAAAPRATRLVDAIRDNETRSPERTSDISALRSVRSEALRGGTNAATAGRRGADYHDLKRIRGIGVLIEKKLNSMGITRYEHIAEWQVADIERISHVLDFKGRIERENWVEQARILAAGGQTEFSRRADRGDDTGF